MPTTAESVPPPATSIADVLQAIASADGKTWFPAEYATETDCPRADLNAPLNELRLAGYVEVIDWVRGRGQGYGLTAAGRKALNLPGPIVLDQPKPRATEANPSRLTPLERGDIARTALFAPRTALVTPVLVTLIVLWFLAGLGLAIRDGGGASAYLRGASPAVLMKLGAVSGSNLLRGEWWRLGSCVFVHIGLLHIAVNLFALLSIGPVAEGLWGRWRFALVFFGSGFAGACVAMAVRPDSALAGASGAV
ncbi:MAG TPA: rhomboid family intramembrane serine protease, partial [Fimbriiglobus sp.]